MSCLLVAIVVSWEVGFVEPSEFSGGLVSGPLLKLARGGVYLFLLVLLLTFVFRHVAAAVSLAACLLCWPLYLFLTFPAISHQIFRGEYSSLSPPPKFIFDKWLIIGMLTLAGTSFVSIRNLWSSTDHSA